MNVKPLFLLLVLSLVSSFTFAQSKTTDALQKKYEGSLALFFYNNTLRMLNQKEDPAFDDLIKDIEKMKFLMIKKEDNHVSAVDYKNLVKEYKAESFEEIMTSRFEGKSFDIFVREKDNKTKGMLVLVNDSTNLFVLDILGSIALNNVTKLYDALDESSDIGNKIKAFTTGKDDKKTRRQEKKQ